MGVTLTGSITLKIIGAQRLINTNMLVRRKYPPWRERRDCAGKRDSNRAVRGAGAGAGELCSGAFAHDSAVLVRRGGDDPARHPHRGAGFQQRPHRVVRRRGDPGCLLYVCHRAVFAPPPLTAKANGSTKPAVNSEMAGADTPTIQHRDLFPRGNKLYQKG